MRGGGYPLLRTVAQYLDVDYHALVVGFTTTADGFAIVDGDGTADADTVLTVPAGLTAAEIEALIVGVDARFR